MTVVYDRKREFMGVPMTKFRDLLIAWDGGGVYDASGKANLEIEPRVAAVLADEAVAQGLFKWKDRYGFRRFSATPMGRALMSASAMKPLPRDRVPAILGDLYERCDQINAREDLHFRVEEIWLFGSYVQGKAEVNDIDLVVELGSTRPRMHNPEGDRRIVEIAKEVGGGSYPISGLGQVLDARLFLERRLVYGPRRHPRLAPSDIHTLKGLACECQLVYDRKRGGRIEDPVLPAHPNSRERSDGIVEKQVMPHLTEAGTLRPVSARLVDFGIGERGIERMWGTEAITEPRDIGGGGRGESGLLEWMERFAGLDGSHSVILHAQSSGGGVALHLARDIREDGDDVVYTVEFGDIYRYGCREEWEKASSKLLDRVAGLMGADFEKIARNAFVLGKRPDVHVDLSGESEDFLAKVLEAYDGDGWLWRTDFADENSVVLELGSLPATRLLEPDISCKKLTM